MELDPITAQVLRHRLWEINNEIGILASRMAASPAVYEQSDYNTAILTADGRGLFSGVGVIRMATALDLVVQSVRDLFGDTIAPGDVFLTNDPYAGALHQMDVAVVAPLFHEQTLVAWTGIVFHELDMGGPHPGSWAVGARDAFQEPPVLPPLRVVRGGLVLPDVEAAFLRNSRTPDALGINLHAKIGAQALAHERILQIVREIGVDDFLALQQTILEEVRDTVRSRLASVPDGQWTVNAFIDHDGVEDRIYELQLTATKRGERLTLDFRGTSPQAAGPINSARSGLVAGVLEVLVPAFCFDVPWSHGAVLDCIDLISEPGTLNNALFPAPTSMATVNACQSTSDLVWQVVAQMFGWTAAYGEEAVALGYSGVNSGVLGGTWHGGRRFVLACSGLGGGGATSYSDGINSGGNIIAPIFSIPNVERLESLAPLLVLHRRERPDTAGAGTWRGGLGIEFAVTAHKAEGPVTGVAFETGFKQPEARGVFGGLPGSAQVNALVRGSDPAELLHNGALLSLRMPSELHLEVLPAKSAFSLQPGDVWVSVATGGGGYGDPLLRDPAHVADDLAHGWCTVDDALHVYGVVIDAGRADSGRTEVERARCRAERLARATRRRSSAEVTGSRSAAVFTNPVLVAYPVGDELRLACKACGAMLGDSSGGIKEGAAFLDVELRTLCAVNELIGATSVFLREFLCPGCGLMISAEPVWRESPLSDGWIERLAPQVNG